MILGRIKINTSVHVISFLKLYNTKCTCFYSLCYHSFSVLDLCDPDPCLNGAYCSTDPLGFYKCDCNITLHGGTNCEKSK